MNFWSAFIYLIFLGYKSVTSAVWGWRKFPANMKWKRINIYVPIIQFWWCFTLTVHSLVNWILFDDNGFSPLCSKGSHSTKVEAVVRTLMRIQLRDPGAKALVFSTVQSASSVLTRTGSLFPVSLYLRMNC